MDEPAGVIDASVLMAAMLGEIDPAASERWIRHSCISTVNLSEVVAKLAERGAQIDQIQRWVSDFKLEVRAFDTALAFRAGQLRPATRQRGLSLGDRACLALAAELGRPAITADRAWAELDLGIPIEVIR